MQLCADSAGEVPVHVWAQAGCTQAGGGVLLRYSRVPLRPVRLLGPAERMGHRVRVQVRPSVLLTAPLYCLSRLVLRCTHCVVAGVDHFLQAQAHHAHGRGSPRVHQGEQVDLARVHEWSDIVMNLSGASAVHFLCATPSTLPPLLFGSGQVCLRLLRVHICVQLRTRVGGAHHRVRSGVVPQARQGVGGPGPVPRHGRGACSHGRCVWLYTCGAW